jgi:hypothetical protein
MLIVLPDELEILRDMQPLDRDVFHYLAERMDFKTGVTGKSRKVSYGGMAYDLTEHDGSRRKPETLQKLSKDQARNAVRRLVNAGLLQALSEQGSHQNLIVVRVFYADLLGLGNCVKNPDATQMPDQLRKFFSVLNNIFNNLGNNKNSSCQEKTNPDAITSYTQHQQQGGDEILMTTDWHPDQSEYEMILYRAGFKAEKVNPLWIREFIDHWASDGKRRYSQAVWTKRLAYRMIDYLRDPGLYDRLHGVNQQRPVNSNSAPSSRPAIPEWACIPRDDEALQNWAMRHGYGGAEPGWTYHQFRNVLRTKVENRLTQWRRMS